jgi:hypothetical protein
MNGMASNKVEQEIYMNKVEQEIYKEWAKKQQPKK